MKGGLLLSTEISGGVKTEARFFWGGRLDRLEFWGLCIWNICGDGVFPFFKTEGRRDRETEN